MQEVIVPTFPCRECNPELSVQSINTPCVPRKADGRLPGKGDLDLHGARPFHRIISMIKWIWTIRLSIKDFLSKCSNPTTLRNDWIGPSISTSPTMLGQGGVRGEQGGGRCWREWGE